MSGVDRKRLVRAFELERKDVSSSFAWGYELCFSVPIKSFYVNELAADLSVPVSFKVFNCRLITDILNFIIGFLCRMLKF